MTDLEKLSLLPKDDIDPALALGDSPDLYNMDLDMGSSAASEPNADLGLLDDPADQDDQLDNGIMDFGSTDDLAAGFAEADEESGSAPPAADLDVNVKEETAPSEPRVEPNDQSDLNDQNEPDELDEEDVDIKSRRITPPKVTDDVEVKREPPLVEDHESDSEEEIDEKPKIGLDVNVDDKTRVRQTHAIVVPSYASWFNMKKIHQIERDSLPEFFNTSHPSKSPKIYANYRNFMVNAYRLNPNEYLTLTSCRRNLVGDVGTLMRVHRLLGKWGLINYQVNPQFKPAYALEKLPNGSLVGLPYSGDFHVQYDTPRGLFPFNTYNMSSENVNVNRLKQLIESGTGMNGNSTLPHGAEEEPPLKKQKTTEDDWSPKELANLLLGIQKHKNDWYKIAKGVGKTPRECILKFLGLPIEDKFTDLSEKDLGILKFAPNFPVMAADNPVIGNLIFMTNLVDCEVVKAATVNASKVIDELLYKRVEEVYGAKPKKETETEESTEEKPEAEGDEAAASNGSLENDEEIKGDEEIDAALKDEFSTDDSKTQDEILKDASTSVFGSIGARSHLFANYEEREMQRLTTTILNHELKKIDVKLNKISELEKIHQRERLNLARLQSEIFVDRLALTKSTVGISKKLNDVISILKTSTEGDATKLSGELENATNLLAEVQSLLFKPTKHSLVEATKPVLDSGAAADDAEAKRAKSEAAIKPLSIETPQAFKVWVP